MSDPEQVAYSDWSLDLHRRVIAGRVPATGTIEVTRRCNLACSHCYNNLPMGDGVALAGELTLDEHRRLVDEIAEAGCLWLLYTGGEIFARRDFLDLYRHARNRGLLLTLFTNGTMVTERIADALAAEPPFALEVTLYGRTRETYEALTGVAGSYDRCLQGIERLRARGVPLKLKTVAVSLNVHEIPAMKRFAEELGCSFSFDAAISPRVDCSLAPLSLRLAPREIVELDLRDPDRLREWDRFAGAFLAPPQPQGRSDEIYHCGAGINSFAVDPRGMMSLCVFSRRDEYDLRRGSFREGWEQFLRGVRARAGEHSGKCRACHLKSICGMCPANGELEHDSPERPVDFLCHLAHLRAGVFGWSVPDHGDCEHCINGLRYSDIQGELADLRRLAAELTAGTRPAPVGRGALPVVGGVASPDGSPSGGAPGSCGGAVNG